MKQLLGMQEVVGPVGVCEASIQAHHLQQRHQAVMSLEVGPLFAGGLHCPWLAAGIGRRGAVRCAWVRHSQEAARLPVERAALCWHAPPLICRRQHRSNDLPSNLRQESTSR